MSGNQLTSIPAELGPLTALKVLDLYGQVFGAEVTSMPVEWMVGGALEESGCDIE
jgi:hypothetical protein